METFIASRMQPARYETTSVKIAAGQYRFTVAASKIVFEGFRSVYTEAGETKEENNVLLKGLDMDSVLTKESLNSKQHFTQPPAHYTEATLVKTLEELGIGRPSTYAPTISTIIARRYVAKENKNLYLTEIGEVVNNIMKQSFPSIVDVNLRQIWRAFWMALRKEKSDGRQLSRILSRSGGSSGKSRDRTGTGED